MDTLLAEPAPVLDTVIKKPIPVPAVTGDASAVFVICSDGARMALASIWLSRLPMEAPSAAVHLMCYGPPLTLPAPRPMPQPRGPVLAARCPPNSSWTFRSTLVSATE